MCNDPPVNFSVVGLGFVKTKAEIKMLNASNLFAAQLQANILYKVMNIGQRLRATGDKATIYLLTLSPVKFGNADISVAAHDYLFLRADASTKQV